MPSCACLIDVEKNKTIFYMNEKTVHDIIWIGKTKSVKSWGDNCGADEIKPFTLLPPRNDQPPGTVPKLYTRSPHPHCTLVRYNIISPMTHKSAEGAAPCSHPGDFDQYAYSQTYSHGSPFTHHTMPGCCASSAREESKWHEARTGVILPWQLPPCAVPKDQT